MNIYSYLRRQFNRFKIDMLTQRTFLAGSVPSIDHNHIIKTVSTNYEELAIIFFEKYRLKPSDVLVDVGCGKGRVFNYLLYKGIKNKMIGYEINKAVADNTARRLRRFKNIEIRPDNIFDSFPAVGNVFYLYNPFKEEMIDSFKSEILKITDRDPVILYNNPIHLQLFKNDRFICQTHHIAVPGYGYTFPLAVIRVRR